MHYGCSSNLGMKQRASYEYLVLELGVSTQPLQESYKKYGGWVTHSWLKTLWGKYDLLNIRVEFNDINLRLLRLGDKWLMLELMRLGYSAKDLLRLNRVRLHQQVVFLSCILGASGKELDERSLRKRQPNE